MFFSVWVVRPSAEATAEFGDVPSTLWIIAVGRTIAFIMGASFFLLVGQLGMRMAIQANVRATAASDEVSMRRSPSPIMRVPLLEC